jgi:hypothetical protein
MVAAQLIPGVAVEVRTAAFGPFHDAMPYTEAVALAVRGDVEGVTSPSGKIRYLRLLPDSERAVDAMPSPADIFAGRSGPIAQTNMGVYRQPVREAIVAQDAFGKRIVQASGDIVGHVFAHRSLRLRELEA